MTRWRIWLASVSGVTWRASTAAGCARALQHPTSTGQSGEPGTRGCGADCERARKTLRAGPTRAPAETECVACGGLRLELLVPALLPPQPALLAPQSMSTSHHLAHLSCRLPAIEETLRAIARCSTSRDAVQVRFRFLPRQARVASLRARRPSSRTARDGEMDALKALATRAPAGSPARSNESTTLQPIDLIQKLLWNREP